MFRLLFKHLTGGRIVGDRIRRAGCLMNENGFRPRLELLEDRTLLSAVTHFQVVAGPPAQVGVPTPVEVVALDASNQIVPTYTGTIRLTSTDTASTVCGTALPATYQFSPLDLGAHPFFITPGAAGTETIAAVDTSASTITGSLDLNVSAAPAVTHFQVLAISHDLVAPVSIGGAVSVAVIAVDASNRPVHGYTGTIEISSTDSATTLGSTPLPAKYTFTTDDHGFHVFNLTPGGAGTETITVADTSTSSITGSITLLGTEKPVATHFFVLNQSLMFAGSGAGTGIVVIAADASNRPVPDYAGTVQISSTDSGTTLGGTVLPAKYTFTADDHGFHVFMLNPGAAGTETITITDTTTASITGNITIITAPAPAAAHFAVLVASFHPDSEGFVGSPTSVEVLVLDASNRPVWNYTGTVRISSTDSATTLGGAALPATYTFTADDHGRHKFTLLPAAVGTETITITDTTTVSITGSVSLIVSAAPVATHIAFRVLPDSFAGALIPVGVEVLDASNQIVPTYTGTIELTSSDPKATSGGFPGSMLPGSSISVPLPVSYTFTADDHGVHFFFVTFATPGSQTVTATDAANAFTVSAAVNVVTFPPPFVGPNPGPPTGDPIPVLPGPGPNPVLPIGDPNPGIPGGDPNLGSPGGADLFKIDLKLPPQ